MSGTGGSDAAAALRVTGGSPTDEEIAAVAALFSRLALERDAVVQRLEQPEQRSTWDRTRRPLRGPLSRERSWPDP